MINELNEVIDLFMMAEKYWLVTDYGCLPFRNFAANPKANCIHERLCRHPSACIQRPNISRAVRSV